MQGFTIKGRSIHTNEVVEGVVMDRVNMPVPMKSGSKVTGTEIAGIVPCDCYVIQNLDNVTGPVDHIACNTRFFVHPNNLKELKKDPTAARTGGAPDDESDIEVINRAFGDEGI